MKIMVIGHARHGKDTVGEILRDAYGWTFNSSSLFCAEKVMMPAFNKLLPGNKHMLPGNIEEKAYGSVQQCYDDRHNHRAFWHQEIAAYCTATGDLARLAREIFKVNDVYCGCRSAREFHAARAEGVFDLSIWVDRSGHLPPESRDSMKLEQWMADCIIDNNDTLENLQRRVIRIVNHQIQLRQGL